MKRLVRWLPLIILIPLLGSGVWMEQIAHQSLLASIKERLMVALYAHSHHLVSHLRNQEQFVQLLTDKVADSLAMGVLPLLDIADAAGHLPDITACAAFDRQGRVLMHSQAPKPPPVGMAQGLPDVPSIRITDPTILEDGRLHYDLFLPLITPGGAPVIGATEAWVGTLGCRFSNTFSEEFTTHRQGLGLSGEVYVVSAKTRLMLTESRFLPNSVGRVKVDTVGVREALKAQNGIASYPDYRDIPVIGAFLYLHDYDWVLLAEMDESEALAPLGRLRMALGLSLGLISVAAGIVGWRYSRRLEEAYAQTEKARDLAQRAAAEIGAVLRGSVDAIFEIDESNTIVMANESAHRMFGWPAGELIGQKITVLMSPEDGIKHETGLTRYLETGEGPVLGKTVAVAGRRRDGSPVPCELSAAVVSLPGGTRRFVGIVRDLTARKQIERQTQQLANLVAVGQLLNGISHEIKNPLFILTGRLQLLKEKLAHREYESLGADLQKIEDAAQRMTGIVQQFTSLARPSQHAMQECSVHDILAEILGILSNELTIHGIRMVREWEPALSKARIWSDPQGLRQIFLNLILNAMQAMAQAHGKGTLTLATAISNGWIEVRIQDDGPGIPPEHQAKLFDPFFTPKPGGTGGIGLGLYTVRVTLMELKGQVAFETEIGRGTTFIVKLPAGTGPTESRGQN